MASIDWENDRRIEHAQMVKYADEGFNSHEITELMELHTESLSRVDILSHAEDIWTEIYTGGS